jgi:hypothetical protein
MRKLYFVLATILIVGSVNANVITGNFSICLPGPNTTQLSASLPPAPITATTPWFSLNPAVATISSTGLVTAVSFGATTISYTDSLGNVYSENVYVSNFPTITAPNGTSTCEGGILQLEGSLFPNPSSPWESLNPSIATVDNTGLVTGVSAGVANILYRNLGGCTTTIPITINPLLSPTITCGLSTPTSVTFNWNPVIGSLSYTIYYTVNGGALVFVGPSATFTYTLSSLAPNDQIVLYVSPSGTVGNCYQVGSASCSASPCPNAGTDGGITICETDTTTTTTINLFSLITGEDLGGVWTRTSGTGGTFNSTAGVFTPNIEATTSTFTYTVLGSNPCPNDTSIATININLQPNAGIDGSTTICDSSFATIDLFSLITDEQAGGTWTRLSGSGGIFNAIAGTYIPAPGATNSVFEYRIAGVAPCVDDTSIATINVNQQPNAGIDGSTTICDSNVATIDLFSSITGEQPGGTWTRVTGSGGIFDAIAGTYILAPGATNSVFEYRIAGVAPCDDDTSIATINVNQQPDAGTDGSTTICDSNVATIDLFSLITGEQPGGTWTRVTGSGGIFDAIAGTYTPASGVSTSVFEYRIIGVLPCVDDFSIATININPQPDAGIDGCISVSDDSAFIIDLYSLITGEQVGGTWTRTSGSGGTFDSLAATYIPAIGATTSTFSYTISGVAPCLDDSSIATIGINEQLGQAVTLFCDLANSTPNSFAFDWNNIGQTSFNFSYSIDGGPTITGNTIVSNYQIFGVTPGQSVTFTVQPVGNLCYSTTTVNCDLLSAVDFESDTVKYYPNPFNDVLNLSFSQSIESIQIFNILGQQVFDTNHRAKDFQINLSHLSSGTYLVKAISNDSTKIFKVVKY